MRKGNILDTRRREQLKSLLYTVLEEMLKKEFFSHPDVVASKERIEQEVLSTELSPFSGAKSLIDSFIRRR